MASATDPSETVPHGTRARILEAAEGLFADRGYAATSISDITEASGVGRALIYYYFRDKEDLHEAILRDGGEQMLRIANEAYAAPGSALDRLRVFMLRFQQLQVRRHSLARIAMRSRLGDGPPATRRGEEDFPLMFAVLARIVREGVARGELRRVDANQTVHMVLGLVHSLVMMELHAHSKSSPRRDLAFATRLLAEGLAPRETGGKAS